MNVVSLQKSVMTILIRISQSELEIAHRKVMYAQEPVT
jgi:hypothetical protein